MRSTWAECLPSVAGSSRRWVVSSLNRLVAGAPVVYDLFGMDDAEIERLWAPRHQPYLEDGRPPAMGNEIRRDFCGRKQWGGSVRHCSLAKA